jgi:phosphoglycerate dehydrogenase-like enzyme
MSSVDDPSIYHDVDIIATLIALPPSRSHCPRLKIVHAITAGVDYISSSPMYGDPSIRWTYSSGIHGGPMAEWVFMTYMAFQKDWDLYRERQRNREWGFHFDAMRTRDLVGQRMGIMGYGSIGRQVGRVARAMGMEVLAFTATEKKGQEEKRDPGYGLPGMGDPEGEFPVEWYSGVGKKALHRFLAAKIDVLVISLPLTEQTRGMLGKEEFEVLAKQSPYGGAFISNIARGEIIKQDELITALKTEGSGVRGAALDVSIPEPLPPDSPLWEAPNCFITPHNSSQNIMYMNRGLSILVQNLQKPKDAKYINEVNTARGY